LIPASDDWWVRPILNLTNPLGNYLFDTVQSSFYNDLKNFSGDAGIFNVIPQDIRTLTGGFVSAVADPLNTMANDIQAGVNQQISNFPQVQSQSGLKVRKQRASIKSKMFKSKQTANAQ
jgi:hypothetical protein